MNQEELAQRLGVTQANMSHIESSVKGPSASILLSLAEALQCSTNEFLGVNIEDSAEIAALEDGERAFVLKTMKSNPQLEVCFRSLVRDQDLLKDEDWEFLATTMGVGLQYISKVIQMRRKQEKMDN